MTNNKEDLQKELKDKVKAGIKPSDIKKLKRSKSADHLTSNPSSSLLPTDQSVQQLQQQLTTTQGKLTNLQKSLGNQDPGLLRKAREDLITIRKRLQTLFPNQTEAKPSELLELLITKHSELTDRILELRFENIKDFGDYLAKKKD
jgi:hypothetical protein